MIVRTDELLRFDKSWRFKSPGPIPQGVVRDFYDLIEKIASQGNVWQVVEQFKSGFGGTGRSSSPDWAWSDLSRLMDSSAENAPLFIEAFWKCCVDLEQSGLGVPDLQIINAIMAEHDAGYEIQLPDLIATRAYTPITVPRLAPSLDEQAHALIDECLAESERLLDAGQGRRAVQEILFLLESITTAFRGMGEDTVTIQGKYFGPIINEMRKRERGKAQESILTWMTTLHGYLSSPTGGGVRHGTDLKEGIAIQPHEARLYCNLARSYLTFLLEEHDQQTKGASSKRPQ
ncbi:MULTISPECIES: hypothetical protein [Pseudomonas]|uniref:hypothetical protein n=1 Tax=Pseudomonas TaxID=286 RepID=UPI001E44CE6B|nr:MULTISPECIES: hypothetical protein [Pseudomonas]MCE0912571.1 hypothetical protein [Pseudomonas kurunegalensis]WJR58509.1 hypothetical protein LU664_013530 [Pseudomonas kurunegalensis]